MSGSNQSHKKTRAAQLPFNVASAARQSLLIGSGFSREELSKPMVRKSTRDNPIYQSWLLPLHREFEKPAAHQWR